MSWVFGQEKKKIKWIREEAQKQSLVYYKIESEGGKKLHQKLMPKMELPLVVQ